MTPDRSPQVLPANPFADAGAVPVDELVVPEVANVPVAQDVIHVDKDNVLAAAKIIQSVVQDEGAAIVASLPELRIRPAGMDMISAEAAEAWNNRLVDAPDSYTNRVEEYLNALNSLVDDLISTARDYGYDEQQIVDAMNAVDA